MARGRGRGRGRPPRRDRGRGRSRTSRTPAAGRRDTVALDALSEIRDNAKVRLKSLNDQERLDLLLEGVDIYTSMVCDLLNRKESPASGGHHPPPGGYAVDWCTSGKCRQMPTAEERDFQVLCLDDSVLRLSQLYRQDVLALNEDQDINRGYRHAGYRQYILWTYGRLGAGVRKVIPSCCIWRIRDKFPDAFGQYVGFITSRIS
ncbi:hypothetical protein FSP39_012825 [Pinctada imbricata]|uniref:P2X purinoreceptor 7 intracellular domain-containing protein n=1 Tax=Pinctada imbricata TaxID=66713 RepID=A0AA89BWB9_PINIB|nr:hypothetical protein FSP39_012825 [Pinctada imbricata]